MTLFCRPSLVAVEHTQALAEQYKAACGGGSGDGTGIAAAPLFPAGKALSLLDAHAAGVSDDRDRATFWTTASDLAKVLLQVRCTMVILRSMYVVASDVSAEGGRERERASE